jgi:hypothetical protein
VVIPAQAIGLGFEKPYDFSGLKARFILFGVSQSLPCGENCGSFSGLNGVEGSAVVSRAS